MAHTSFNTYNCTFIFWKITEAIQSWIYKFTLFAFVPYTYTHTKRDLACVTSRMSHLTCNFSHITSDMLHWLSISLYCSLKSPLHVIIFQTTTMILRIIIQKRTKRTSMYHKIQGTKTKLVKSPSHA